MASTQSMHQKGDSLTGTPSFRAVVVNHDDVAIVKCDLSRDSAIVCKVAEPVCCGERLSMPST